MARQSVLLRLCYASYLLLPAILQGCKSSDDGKGGKASCGKEDLLCLCKADCESTCHNFNITKMADGTECAKCMTSKCAEEAKGLCPQDRVSLCHNCITDGAWCWATTWPTCVKQCLEWQLSSAAQFSLCSRFQCFHARWDPIECTQCWLTNYTSTCLGKYDHCFESQKPNPLLEWLFKENSLNLS
ncbi:unnamed protein product [Durusdinium trenchii]|uniref:Uncharacterized protein n=1 Tax=Durusdinium trenchii TaxID=1381693 RepID=A0ABP0P906_9DINO